MQPRPNYLSKASLHENWFLASGANNCLYYNLFHDSSKFNFKTVECIHNCLGLGLGLGECKNEKIDKNGNLTEFEVSN